MTDEPKLLAEPREGVPNVIDTLPAFRDYCSELASSHGSRVLFKIPCVAAIKIP